MGDDDSMVIVPIGRDCFRNTDFIKKVYYRINRKSYIVAKRNKHLIGLAAKHNIKYRNKKIESDEPRITCIENNISE